MIYMQKKRRPELSMLNVLFCLTVIFIHIISYAVAAFPQGTVAYNLVLLPWRLATFVVQGFIMLAGVKLFLNGKDSLPFHRYIKGRFFGIIIPYTVCYAIYYIYYMLVYDYPLDISFILKHYFFGSLACHMYFIPLIFQFDLLFPLWKRLVNKCSPVIVLPFALLLTLLCETYLPQIVNTFFPAFNFIYNDRLFTTYLIYWLIGCYIGKNYDSFCEILKKNFISVFAAYALAAITDGIFSYLAYNGLAYVPYLSILHMLYILYACIFLFAVFLKFGDRLYGKIPLVSKIDKFSFYIYLYHMLIILVAQYLLIGM